VLLRDDTLENTDVVVFHVECETAQAWQVECSRSEFYQVFLVMARYDGHLRLGIRVPRLLNPVSFHSAQLEAVPNPELCLSSAVVCSSSSSRSMDVFSAQLEH